MLFRPIIGTDLSGSIGGIVASHNRGGAYFRNRSIPVNPSTPGQIKIRGFVASLSILWSTVLTQAERDAWDLYAANTPVQNKIGASIFLTGLNMYVRSNVPILQAAETRIDTAPSVFGLAVYTDPTIASITAPSALSIGFTSADTWANTDGGALFVYASRPVNSSINFFKGPFQFAGVVLGDAAVPPVSPAAIVSPFAYVAGQKVFLRFNITDGTGRPGSDQIQNAAVV